MHAWHDGKPLDDLQAAEVELLEDGVPQKIDSFEHVKVDAPGSPRARVFVVFLDTRNTHIESSSTQKLPLIKVLDRVIGSGDMVAVMTPEMSPSRMTFGRKAAVISNIMQSDWAWARGGRTARDEKEDLYDACYPSAGSNENTAAAEMKVRRREKLALNALDGLVADLGGVREERKAILLVSDGWTIVRENPDLAGQLRSRERGGIVDRLLRRPAKEPTKEKSGETGGPKEVNYIECEADRAALAALDHSQRLRALTEEANRRNISFYAIDPRGIVPETAGGSRTSADARPENAASRQDSLRFLADNTDGLLLASTRTLDAQIARIVEDMSSYYLIGYRSSNTRLDGRVRTIAVRVKRDGVTARVRRGYRGRTAGELISGTGTPGLGGRAFGTAPATAGSSQSRFRIRTSTWVPDPVEAAAGMFWIVGELDYQTRRQLAWTAGAEAELVVVNAAGQEVMTRTVDLKADEGPFSIQVPETGTIAAGEYAVRVRLRSHADGNVELADTARVVLREGSSLGEAVLWRRGLSTGPRYLRTADPRFIRSDRLKLELATTAQEPAKARILDRNHNELPVPAQVGEREDPSGAFRWIVVDAMLAPFAAGDYAIEVTQGRARRITDFKVVP